MIERMIIDADICIKLGDSEKYQFLYDILPLVSDEVYMHSHAFGEVIIPSSAVKQLQRLVDEGKVIVVSEKELDEKDRAVFDIALCKLERVMSDPRRPNKNRGEMFSLAYAKTKGIPVFATDEMNLQPIIDSVLNDEMDDITCVRIVDIVRMAADGEIIIPRKVCKALWLIAGKKKETFDADIWPI